MIYQHLKTLQFDDQVKLVKSIIKKYKKYCGVYACTQYYQYYLDMAGKNPVDTLERFVIGVSDLMSLEKYEERDDGTCERKFLSEIEEEFLPDEDEIE